MLGSVPRGSGCSYLGRWHILDVCVQQNDQLKAVTVHTPSHHAPGLSQFSPRQELELYRIGGLGLDVACFWQKLYVASQLLADFKL